MQELGLGKVITTPQKRDAIHIAIVPVTATTEKLFPGQHVDAQGTMAGARVGIVDPYLTVPVKKGETFWLYLYPGSVTSLRHVWTHPAFAEETDGR